MSYRHVALLGVVAASAAAFALTAESGLAKGENVSPFHPAHFAGPLAGTDKCFPCTFQARPQVQVWVNGDDTKNVLAIAKTLSKAVEKNKDREFKAMVVFLAEGERAGAIKQAAGDAAKAYKLDNVAMAILSPSDDAVKAYKVNLADGVKNTVFAYKGWKVENKMVNLKADEKGQQALTEAINTLVK